MLVGVEERGFVKGGMACLVQSGSSFLVRWTWPRLCWAVVDSCCGLGLSSGWSGKRGMLTRRVVVSVLVKGGKLACGV